jgi:hypothetical protein
MFEVHVVGFKTKEQAEAFIHAYEGQGEQTAAVWFECRQAEGKLDVDTMNCDCKATYPLKWHGNAVQMVVDPR